MNKFLKMVVDASPLRTTHFVLLYVLGYLVSLDEYGMSLSVGKLILGLLATTFGWFFVVSINNYFDREADRKSNPERGIPQAVYSERELLIFTAANALLGAILSALLSTKTLIFYLLFIFLGHIYSCPRIYLKKYGIKTVIIGLGSSLVFSMGFFTEGNFEFTENFQFMFIIVLVIFSVGSLINDLKDIEADREHGVITPYTLFGRRWGKVVTILLLLLAFTLPSLITPQGLWIYSAIAVMAAALLWFERVKFIYLLYFLEYLLLLYFLL